MKNSVKYCCITVILGILAAILVFALLNSYALYLSATVPFYMLLILTGMAVLLFFLCKCKAKEMYSAYCCCGNMAVIGAAGMVVIGFFGFLLSGESTLLLHIILAVLFFFLILMAGGIICYLYTIMGCKKECQTTIDCGSDCGHKEYIYTNQVRR